MTRDHANDILSRLRDGLIDLPPHVIRRALYATGDARPVARREPAPVDLVPVEELLGIQARVDARREKRLAERRLKHARRTMA